MAPTYKITYFDIEGLGEALRLLLSYGGAEWEDERITHEEWPTIKPTTPYGNLPQLTVNGKKAGQSIAIARYLAKQFKLVGNDDWENLEIDSIADTLTDWRNKMTAYHLEKDEEIKKKKEPEKNAANDYYLSKFNEIVGKNNGYLALGRLTWADILFFSFTSYMVDIDKYPHLAALKDKVSAIPNIKKWVDKRPANKLFVNN